MIKTLSLKTLTNGEIISEEIKIEITQEFDIIVAGLGTTGSISAICCAESGLKVLGIERLSGMGGIGTFGCIWPYFFGAPGGRFEEINKTARTYYKKGYTMAEPQDGIGDVLYFWDPKGVSLGIDRYVPGPLKELCLEDALRNAGGNLEINSLICGVFCEGNRVCGVRYIKNGKFYDAFAKVVIDALGDAYISRLAGSPVDAGRETDGAIMNFVKGYGRREKDLIRGYFWSTGYNQKLDVLGLSREHLKTSAGMNMKATNECRVLCESAMPTLREVPHIKGMRRLTLEDYAKDTVIEEPLFYMHAPLDNTNADVGFESVTQQNWSFLCHMDGKYAISCGVPMKLLFPVKENDEVIENLVTIGRGMSIDHDICGSFRMKKDYEKLGEASAVVCVNAVKNGIAPHKVSYNEIKPILEKSGCFDIEGDRPITEFVLREGEYNVRAKLPENEDELISILESDKPSLAYWSMCKKGLSSVTDKILEKALSKGKFRKNYAIAVGLAGSDRVNGVLTELVSEDLNTDSVDGDTIRMYVLAARLGCRELIDLTLPLAENITDTYFCKRQMRIVDLRVRFSCLTTSLHSLNEYGVEVTERALLRLLERFKDQNEYTMLKSYITKLTGE